MHEALYYQLHEQGIACQLCPKSCTIGEGESGFCRVRQHRSGKLYTANYAACTSFGLDPIEKKPLYHFYPGSAILSIGTWGCNLACQFCQNWQIAQADPPTSELPPAKAVVAARQAGSRNIGIAYTYSEPTVWYEYILDTARLTHEAGLKNILVTNGFINQEPLEELLPHIDAMNIDVKAFTNDFYRHVCAGTLDAVKRTVEVAATQCHVEITTLLVPGLNDDPQEIEALAKWLGGIRRTIPLHFSRYFPQYKMDAPPTSIHTMERAYHTARHYVDYVYLGNVGAAGTNTHCPACGYTVIERLEGVVSHLNDDKQCPECSLPIPIIGEVLREDIGR